MSDKAAYVEAPRYTVGESKSDGMSAQVWRGSDQYCLVWRDTSEKANYVAQQIADALNGAMRLHEIGNLADDTHSYLIELDEDAAADGIDESIGTLEKIVGLVRWPDEMKGVADE